MSGDSNGTRKFLREVLKLSFTDDAVPDDQLPVLMHTTSYVIYRVCRCIKDYLVKEKRASLEFIQQCEMLIDAYEGDPSVRVTLHITDDTLHVGTHGDWLAPFTSADEERLNSYLMCLAQKGVLVETLPLFDKMISDIDQEITRIDYTHAPPVFEIKNIYAQFVRMNVEKFFEIIIKHLRTENTLLNATISRQMDATPRQPPVAISYFQYTSVVMSKMIDKLIADRDNMNPFKVEKY